MRVYLSAIRLTNCQSFKDSVIEFATDRLNVFVADNSTGKSVFFRMLSITAFPGKCSKEDRLNIIRRGSQFAQILYMFSDGSYGGVRVYPDRVIYYYTPDKNTKMTPSLEPGPEFISKLGLILDNNSGFEQYEDRLKDVVYSYSKSIDGYSYVDTNSLEANIELCENVFDTLYKLAPISDDVEALACSSERRLDYDRLLGVTGTLIKLEQLKEITEGLHVPHEFNEKLLSATCACIKLEQALAAIEGFHIPRSQKDRSNNLHTLLLESIKNELISCWAKEMTVDYSPVVRTLQRLEQLRDYSTETIMHSRSLAQSQQALVKIYDALSSSGELIACGLYGEVVFDGKKCIPADK